MKKILALLLVGAMLFAFAACGGNNDDPTEPPTTTSLFDDIPEETEALTDEQPTGEVPSGEETTAAVDEPTTAAPVINGTTAAPAPTTAVADTKGLNSTDIAAVVDYYNAAVKKTNKEGAPAGQSTMRLSGSITGDGAIGAILSFLSPAAESALKRNSTPTDYIPGNGLLKASDVTRAQATSKNGVTTITLQIKDQTDGSDGDAKNGGPVARAIGTLGSIDSALEELGAELTSGRETVKLTYNDCFIKCTINENTGKITGGTWHYVVNVLIGNAKAKLGISANLKNLKAAIDYSVVI